MQTIGPSEQDKYILEGNKYEEYRSTSVGLVNKTNICRRTRSVKNTEIYWRTQQGPVDKTNICWKTRI